MASLLKFNKYGLAEPVKGLIVQLPWKNGRTLLGHVMDAYRNETIGCTMLKVRHFNGEMWPIDPAASAVRHVD